MTGRWVAFFSSAWLMATPAVTTNAASAASFSLVSPQFTHGSIMANEQVFNGMGCKGDNISPELRWSNVPAGTKSYAVTVFDPDAPTGSGWWHWVVFNLPASMKALPLNAGQTALKLLPEASIQSRTDFGKSGYGGACPPVGDKPHRYFFTVWALNTESLPLNANASGAMVGYYLNQHALAKATLVATYQRPK
jgi:Raf kinase inhibitor-like YbhB/YbcL family protein